MAKINFSLMQQYAQIYSPPLQAGIFLLPQRHFLSRKRTFVRNGQTISISEFIAWVRAGKAYKKPPLTKGLCLHIRCVNEKPLWRTKMPAYIACQDESVLQSLYKLRKEDKTDGYPSKRFFSKRPFQRIVWLFLKRISIFQP